MYIIVWVWTSQHTVSCILTMSPDLPTAPGTPSVSFSISGEQFNISWDEPPRGMIDTYFVNVSGPDDQCGSVNVLHRFGNSTRNYACSGWSLAGQRYTFTVAAANCGGDLRGPITRSISVFLQGMLRYNVFCSCKMLTWLHTTSTCTQLEL